MPFSIEQYAALRPMLWHLTHRDNVPLIRACRQLLPAAVLAPDAVTAVRRGQRIAAGHPVLRDQDLLHEACIELSGGWVMEDFLRDLASRVFFWFGWPKKPVLPGRHAALRYQSDVVIRVPFRDLVVGQTGQTPQFSRCNSGATRMQRGQRVVRGPQTFQEAVCCRFAASDVIEVTFVRPVALPPTAEFAESPSGPWLPLWSGDVPTPAASLPESRDMM